VSCFYRWITNKDQQINGLIAGFFAGWSMMFYKSSSIAMYLNVKLLEVLWMLGVANKTLPLWKSFDVILYSVSTAFVLWVVSILIFVLLTRIDKYRTILFFFNFKAIFEPHNIRHSYWKFMVNISNNKFREVDRYALDSFGTEASLLDRLGKA